ncbi:hypothetical protein L1987_18793 [Smallanthus sonchifolius]|uniref:Uncharacterized protein n=1 Tax=Smallanthus sonchifolius TaxID=185202 RepID=A0ACB9J2W4_9ASTR|nr:hypothetical protein L1987_18793 [Smallanthus sonchifolius]
MHPQCFLLGDMGKGGTKCTHHTSFGERKRVVHNTVGRYLGKGLADWANYFYLCMMQEYNQDITAWSIRSCMRDGLCMHTYFGLGWGRGGTPGTLHFACERWEIMGSPELETSNGLGRAHSLDVVWDIILV